jgi:hypothetical protein
MKAEDIQVGGYYQSYDGCVALVKAVNNANNNAERDTIIEYDLFNSKGQKTYTSYARCSMSGFAGWAKRRVKPRI